VRELKGLATGVVVRARGLLRRGPQTRTLSLGDLTWRTSRETGATAWRIGRSPAADVQLWWRESGPAGAILGSPVLRPEPREGASDGDVGRDRSACRQVELIAGVAAARPWTLSEWTFDVRIEVERDARFSWPFAAGAIVPVRKLADAGRTLELTYPVYGSMQWVDVFSTDGGLYVAAHAPEPYFKHFRVRASRQRGKFTLAIEIIYTDLEWPAGKEWISPPLLLARHAGDWRQGAGIYRAWADSWFHHEPAPEFMRQSCGHNMIAFPTVGGRWAFKTFPAIARQTRRLGIDGIHVADWMQEGFDTFYPAYKADPALGGEKALRSAIRRMAREGSWTCLYLNGRLLDPAGPHGEHAFEWAVKVRPHVKRRFAEMWERT